MLILASKSPRRSELLKRFYSHEFLIDPSDVDESSAIYDTKYNKALATAQLKIVASIKKHPHDTILAADTIVILDQEILEKPRDYDDAYRMLKLLGDRPHQVVTGYHIAIDGKLVASKNVITTITLKSMDDKMIKTYIETGSPFDKAGGYGIQDKDYIRLLSIEGSMTNVMGLPIEELEEQFKKLGI